MTTKLKEMFKIFLTVAITVIMTSCSVLTDISSSLIELKVTYDDIGEIYCNSIDINHIVGDDVINYMDNEILVVAQPSVTKEKMAMLANKYNAEIVGFIEKTGDYQLQIADVHTKDDLQSVINKIETENEIESACLNYVYEISEDTINYGKQWEKDLKNYTDCKGKSWGIEAIRAPEAWKLLEENSEKINKNLRIGLIDGGFDLTHEDLGFAEKFENYNGNLQDSNKNHGTHVAGTMAASSDNTKGICGVYPYGNGNLYGISSRGISSYSENGTYWKSVMIEKIALAELILRNVKVINQSQGFNWYQFKTINIGKSVFTAWWDNFNVGDYSVYKTQSNLIGDFLNRLINNGYDFVLVCAAGNDSEYSTHHLESEYNSWLNLIDKEKYPNVYNRIIVVGSVDKKYNISNFSNTGERVDIYAPGEEIFSTKPNNKYGTTFKDLDENGVIQTYLYSGTSMASPHVAGIAAMVWAADSKLTGEQVKMIVCNSISYKSSDVKIADAKIAVMIALKINDEQNEFMSESYEPKYGSIMSYIVDKKDESLKISGAHITVENVDDGSCFSADSDIFGHFELVLPEGMYKISINANDYETYTYPDYVQCAAQQVHYIDWAKLVKIESPSDSFKPDGEYIKVDFDNDGKNEIFAIEDISTYKHKLWYYDDDLSKTQLEEIDDSAFCKLKVISSEYGNHVYLNKIQDKNCSIDNIYFSIYINKNNQPYCSNSGRGSLEYTDSSELIWHYEGHDIHGFAIGNDYQLEYNDDENKYFNVILNEKELLSTAQKLLNDNIVLYSYSDYDNNGISEAFVVFNGSENSQWVYYIDGFGLMRYITDVPMEVYTNYSDNYILKCDNKCFFRFDYGAGGSGWHTMVFGVKDTIPYELDISRGLQGLYYENEMFYTTENDFRNGFHEYPTIELIYDKINQQFIRGNRIEPLNIEIDPDTFEYCGHHYMVYQDVASTFERAKEYCENRGGHLAVINNEKENMAIFNYMKNLGIENAYFGYSDTENEGTWKWYGDESQYTNWHQNEPNSENSHEDYAMFYYKYTDGTWNDGDFGSNTVNGGTNFICEWDL